MVFSKTLNFTQKKPYAYDNSKYSHVIKTTGNGKPFKVNNIFLHEPSIQMRKRGKIDHRQVGQKPISFSAMTSPIRSPIKIKHQTHQKSNVQFTEQGYQKKEDFFKRYNKQTKHVEHKHVDFLKNKPYIFTKDTGRQRRFKRFDNSVKKNQNFFKQLDQFEKKIEGIKNVKQVRGGNTRVIDKIATNLHNTKHSRVKSSNLNATDINNIHKNLVSNSRRFIRKI